MCRPLKTPGNLEEELLSAVASACNVGRSEVSLLTNVLDIGLDSLALVAVITHLESMYNFNVEADFVVAAFAVDTVGELLSCIEAAQGLRPC